MSIVVTSRFNPARKHPVTGVVMPHNGTDFRASTWTPIYATVGGTVNRYTNARAGNRVEIIAGNTTLGHSHMSQILPIQGDKVKRGDLLGYSGATGSVTAAHLHFDVRVNGVWKDPVIWLKGRKGHPLKSISGEEDMPLNNDDKAWIENAIKQGVHNYYTAVGARETSWDRSVSDTYYNTTRSIWNRVLQSMASGADSGGRSMRDRLRIVLTGSTATAATSAEVLALDTDQIASELAAEIAGQMPSGSLTPDQVQNAAENAIRGVLGSLNE